MSTTIHVIYERDDEHCNYIIAAFFDEQKAKEKYEELVRETDFLVKLDKEFVDNEEILRKEFEASNPRPQLEEIPDRPRWPSGLSREQITTAMVAERENWKKIRDEINERNAQLHGDWYSVWNKKVKELANTLSNDKKIVQRLIDRNIDNRVFSMDTLEVI